MYIYVCMYVCKYVCMYVCVCIYIYIYIERERLFTTAGDNVVITDMPRIGVTHMASTAATPTMTMTTHIIKHVTALSCDIHTHTPAQQSYTDFILYPFVIYAICYLRMFYRQAWAWAWV